MKSAVDGEVQWRSISIQKPGADDFHPKSPGMKVISITHRRLRFSTRSIKMRYAQGIAEFEAGGCVYTYEQRCFLTAGEW